MEIMKESVLQFEYKVMTYYGLMEAAVTQDILKEKNTSSEDVLNELGKDGWELFAILREEENSLFIFKRSKWVENKAQEKQEDNANKVERKFKVGDWIVNQHRTIRHIEEVGNVGYQTDEGWLTHDSYEKDFHLWTIQDAKDGDVLVCEGKISKDKYGQQIGIVKKYVGRIGGCDNCFETYCFIDWEGNFRVSKSMGSPNIHPATKEQCNLLLSEMHKAGYEWNNEKKELKKIGQTPAWSEEDEKMFVDLIKYCDTSISYAQAECYKIEWEKRKDWLKSIKDRVGCEANCTTMWKPSEEQMDALLYVVQHYTPKD